MAKTGRDKNTKNKAKHSKLMDRKKSKKKKVFFVFKVKSLFVENRALIPFCSSCASARVKSETT